MKLTYKGHTTILIVVSILFVLVNSLVTVEGFPLQIQFGEDDFSRTIEFLSNRKHASGFCHLHFFKASIVIDIVWAPILLFFLYRTAKEKLGSGNFLIMPALILVTLFFDYWENTIYLIGDEAALWLRLDFIKKIKVVCYSLTFLLFIYCIIKYVIDHWNRSKIYPVRIIQFLQYNFISLIIIIIILALLTQMDQGATVMVDLLMRPVNLFFMFFLFFFFAIVLSHYPSYLRAVMFRNQSKIEWMMEPFILSRHIGIGLVYFSKAKTYKNKISIRESRTVKLLRHSIGLAVLSVFIYTLLFVGANFEVTPAFLVPELALGTFILSIYVYRKIRKRHFNRKLLNITLLITVALMFISSALSATIGWSVWTLALSIVTLLALKFLYILFRVHRFHIIGNIRLIRSIAITGFSTLIFLVVINAWIGFAVTYVNPLLIILMYLINIYGLLMLTLKHLFFYWDQENIHADNPYRLQFTKLPYVIPLIVLAALIWTALAAGLPNDLHTLETHKIKDSDAVSVETYLEKINTMAKDSLPCYFQVSSYGGGLKANLWTLLVMNTLEKRDKEFLSRTISMSGTSGGMLGLGNFAALHSKSKPHPGTSIEQSIVEIGKLNHLAVDITYLMGWDLIRELVPLKKGYYGDDRSWKAMEFYAECTGLSKSHGEPFQHTFKKLYDSNKYFPPLIINTFATSGIQGVGVSIKSDYKAPGAINILTDTSQINYYSALSTSNRFPIFSPTANIANKGHFLDGGYFDNSALTSTLAFRDYIIKKVSQEGHKNLESLTKKDIKTIVINSSKTDYIKSLFNKLVIKKHGLREDQVGEFSAIISGITGLDKVPSYFEGQLEDAIHFYLPQPFDYLDVVKAYDGEPRIAPGRIIEIIENENKKICEALDAYGHKYRSYWGVVSPALARLNSEPAVYYQMAMMSKHPDIEKALMDVKAWR